MQLTTQSIKIMTFNVRTSDGEDGINNWNSGRKERALQLIQRYQPDILGVQEATNNPLRGNQVDDLKHLQAYTWYGVGRNADKNSGEYEGIMFLTSRFNLVEAGEFWLSHTPHTPGGTFADARDRDPRMATWVILHDILTNKQIFVLNQHWSYLTDTQRESTLLVREQLVKLNPDFNHIPIVIMGDFNMSDQPSSELYSLNPQNLYTVMLNGENHDDNFKLIDAYRSIHQSFDVTTQSERTFHNYHGNTNYLDDYLENIAHNYRIDFIFTSTNLSIIDAQIIQDNQSENHLLWPSDHYPVMVTITHTTPQAVI